MNVRKLFKELRFNEKHHLGLGDIRLTHAQQMEIEDYIQELEEAADYMEDSQ